MAGGCCWGTADLTGEVLCCSPWWRHHRRRDVSPAVVQGLGLTKIHIAEDCKAVGSVWGVWYGVGVYP